jgi:SpoVK/Ycf46/Vps4 family AAA+-type ATPase
MRLVGGWSDIDSEAREYQEIMRQKLPRPTHGKAYEIPMGITPGIYDLDEGFDVSKTESKRLGLHSDEVFVFRDKGSQELREEIKRFWMSGKQFQEAGLLHKRGIMLYGEPGSGKTTMIRQEMKELAKTQIVFFSKSPYQLQRILAEVRAVDKKTPVTVVMEDIDELANGWGLHGLLEMLDGANAQDRVLYIGTTNNLTEMPEKLKRPGRFDRKINIPNPDKSLRMEYIQKKFPKLNEQQMKSLADLTEDLSFGHLREIVVSHLGYKIPLKDAVARVREDVKLERSAERSEEKKAY